MASKTTVLILLCLIMASLSQATKVTYCDKSEDYAVKVSKVEIKPNPVVRGEPATFSISANAAVPFAGGRVDIDVKFYGIHVHSETHDLCEETPCPVSSGDFLISHTQALPGFTPPGSYTLTMIMFDSLNPTTHLTCFSFNFKIRLGSPVAQS